MSDAFMIFTIIVAWINGVVLGFLLWAPETAFKKGFVDGITFKWLWSRNKNGKYKN